MTKVTKSGTASGAATDAASPAKNATSPPPPPPPPPPPRLIGAQPPQATNPRHSHYLDKLASKPEDYLLRRPQPRPYVYKPIWYFFYGTLTDPAILRGVLGLDSEPVLHSAKVYGYELTNWGQYKALIDGAPGTEVAGRAYMVQSVEEEYKLAYYETNAYNLAPCRIHFTRGPDGIEDEDGTIGKTFLYAGDAQALMQGRFDWALWERQMGARLPPKWRKGEDDIDKEAPEGE